MRRIVALPVDETEEDSKARFRNGALKASQERAASAERFRIAIG